MTSGIKLFSNVRRVRNSCPHPGHQCRKPFLPQVDWAWATNLIFHRSFSINPTGLLSYHHTSLKRSLLWLESYRPGHDWTQVGSLTAPVFVVLTEEGTAMSLEGAIWAQYFPCLQGFLELATSSGWQWGLGFFAEQYFRNFDTYSRKNGGSFYEVGIKERLGPIYLALFYPFHVTSSWGF